MFRQAWMVLLVVWGFSAELALAQDSPSPAEASAALHKAVDFFRHNVSASGGYLFRYSADLTKQEGEAGASRTTAWVQPPGTPSVGGAFLFAYEATGDTVFLDAARETALALVQGQLQSGGWDYRIEFDAKDRGKYAYHVNGKPAETARNVSTRDDNTTQAALRFLLRVDQTLQFREERIHAAVLYALSQLLAAQYPNGAWPQRFSGPPDPALHPVVKASYPDSWPREFPNVNYSSFYTFNDNSLADMIATMFEASRIYNEPRYAEAAKRAGDFILLAQMPDPQPAWAQQYNAQMQPAWARKFEPASVTGGESQGILRILLSLYRETGDQRYLEPIPRALKYLEASQLPDGKMARFYELQTNRPLYFTKQYELTYSDADLPTHYGFKVSSNLKSIAAEYETAKKADPQSLRPRDPTPSYKMSQSLADSAAQVVESLDERGAWVTDGRLSTYGEDDPTRRIIESSVFVKNVETLSKFLAASK